MHQRIVLPDTLALWPWKSRRQNPFSDEVMEQSAAWLLSFSVLGQKAQRAFETGKFGLLAALAYPDLDKERFRTGCDLMILFFVIDDFTDEMSTSEVREISNTVMDALRNPEKPRADEEWVIGEIMRQFWILARKTATTSSQQRFIKGFDVWLQGLVAQAEDRDKPCLRDIDTYLAIRRMTIGLKPSLSILHLGMAIPREVLEHPTIERLALLCTDMMSIDNDILSYNKEQACGDDHNLIAIAMNQLHLDVQGAMTWAAGYHAATMRQFKEVYETIPHWGREVDLDVEKYVDGMGNWIRANVQWSFESQRYFGNKSDTVLKMRRMSLLPRTRPENGGMRLSENSPISSPNDHDK